MQVVLDPIRYEGENFGRLTEGPTGDLMFVNIVEPQVTVYLPALAYPLSERRTFLASFLQPDQRQQTEASIDRWRKSLGENSAAGSRPDTSDYYLRSAEQAVDPRRKNQLFYRAASAAVNEKKHELALAIVEKMSDEYRDQAKRFIQYDIALQAVRDGSTDVAEEWARRNVDLAQRAFLYTSLAKSLLKTPERSLSQVSDLLNQVEEIAGRLDQNREKGAVLIGAANIAAEFDAGRAFTLLREGIKAVNKLDGFSGDTLLPRSLNIGGFYFDYALYRNEFTLTDVVQRLGRTNFDQAASDVREMKSRLARLRAIISLCAGALANMSSA